MPIVSTTKMTAQQYLQLGDDPPGVRLELVDGEVAASPSASPGHSHAIVKIIRILDEYIEANSLGELFADVDTVLDKFNVRRPDILYFASARMQFVGKKAMEGPPDLAVEVLSPSSIEIDRDDKFAQYREAGVAFYWIVDPIQKTIESWRLAGGAYVQAGHGYDNDVVSLPPFPLLKIPLRRLWRPAID